MPEHVVRADYKIENIYRIKIATALKVTGLTRVYHASLFNLINRVQTQWHDCNNGMYIVI